MPAVDSALLSSFSAFLQNCVALVAVVTNISYGQEAKKMHKRMHSLNLSKTRGTGWLLLGRFFLVIYDNINIYK